MDLLALRHYIIIELRSNMVLLLLYDLFIFRQEASIALDNLCLQFLIEELRLKFQLISTPLAHGHNCLWTSLCDHIEEFLCIQLNHLDKAPRYVREGILDAKQAVFDSYLERILVRGRFVHYHITIDVFELFRALSRLKRQDQMLRIHIILSELLDFPECLDLATDDKHDLVTDVTLYRDHCLRLNELQSCQILHLFLETGRGQFFDLWELVKEVVVKILGAPDALIVLQGGEDEVNVDTMRHTQDGGLMLIFVHATRFDLINDVVEERIGHTLFRRLLLRVERFNGLFS